LVLVALVYPLPARLARLRGRPKYVQRATRLGQWCESISFVLTSGVRLYLF